MARRSSGKSDGMDSRHMVATDTCASVCVYFICVPQSTMSRRNVCGGSGRGSRVSAIRWRVSRVSCGMRSEMRWTVMDSFRLLKISPFSRVGICSTKPSSEAMMMCRGSWSSWLAGGVRCPPIMKENDGTIRPATTSSMSGTAEVGFSPSPSAPTHRHSSLPLPSLLLLLLLMAMDAMDASLAASCRSSPVLMAPHTRRELCGRTALVLVLPSTAVGSSASLGILQKLLTKSMCLKMAGLTWVHRKELK
mmetsp:Transcript_34589/g.85773  ORF Transcript_34589/g.85773 Transcript_34589/m.85773 type:complete len:249 (-) Transcript_34589:360-1106(-)